MCDNIKPSKERNKQSDEKEKSLLQKRSLKVLTYGITSERAGRR